MANTWATGESDMMSVQWPERPTVSLRRRGPDTTREYRRDELPCTTTPHTRRLAELEALYIYLLEESFRLAVQRGGALQMGRRQADERWVRIQRLVRKVRRRLGK